MQTKIIYSLLFMLAITAQAMQEYNHPRLLWKSSLGLFLCQECIRGFPYEKYKEGCKHDCSEKAPLKFIPNAKKKLRCSGCNKRFYFTDPEATLHICKKRQEKFKH